MTTPALENSPPSPGEELNELNLKGLTPGPGDLAFTPHPEGGDDRSLSDNSEGDKDEEYAPPPSKSRSRTRAERKKTLHLPHHHKLLSA